MSDWNSSLLRRHRIVLKLRNLNKSEMGFGVGHGVPGFGNYMLRSLRPVCAGGVKRPIGIFKRIDEGGNECFDSLLWHNDSQDLDLRLLSHSPDIVRKPSISREAKIVVSGDLTVERPVIDPFELQMINRVNLMAQASQGNHQRLRHVPV